MTHHNILIADDDKGLIRLLRTVLQPLGVQIRETYDAVSALTLIHGAPPSLVILDVNMPSGNGLSACEMLATDTWLSRVPVIILTGDSSDTTLLRCQKMNAYYVHKGSDAVHEVKRLVCRLLSITEETAPAQEIFVG
ncbi:MAG: mtrA [Phycisphaerales bacterium]|nr:mtrA [Phycisphaerales bacterium]